MKQAHWTVTLLLAATGCLDPNEPGNLVPKTVAQDPGQPHIAVNGTLLHAEAYYTLNFIPKK